MIFDTLLKDLRFEGKQGGIIITRLYFFINLFQWAWATHISREDDVGEALGHHTGNAVDDLAHHASRLDWKTFGQDVMTRDATLGYYITGTDRKSTHNINEEIRNRLSQTKALGCIFDTNLLACGINYGCDSVWWLCLDSLQGPGHEGIEMIEDVINGQFDTFYTG